MRTSFLLAAFLASVLVAEAHVTIQPRESKTGATEQYVVRVPTEGDVTTTSVELEVPEGVTIASVEAPAGSRYDTKRVGDRIVTITWTTEIKPRQSQQFQFTASNPTQGAQIVWKAHQRYADGTSREWVEAAGAESPAPVTTLAAP